MKKIIAVLLVLSLLFSLSACGTESAVEEETASKEAEEDVVFEDDTNNELLATDLAGQRQILFEDDLMCGAAFISLVDADAGTLAEDPGYYKKLFLLNGLDEKYDYILSIESDCFAASKGGQELYLVVPRDEAAWVTVFERNANGDHGEVLYAGIDGSPILIKCNAAGAAPDVCVVIEDSDENALEWSPMKSASADKLVKTDGVCNFNDYAG